MTSQKKHSRSGAEKLKRAGGIAVNAFVLGINALFAAALIISAYAHDFSPSEWGNAVIVAMTFPAWGVSAFIIFFFDLALWRRTSWIMGVALLICAGPISDYCPLHIPHGKLSEEQKERSFTLMTYNVFNFNKFNGDQPESNIQIDHIISQAPDVVCLQEASFLSPTEKNKITPRQIAKLDSIYPYMLTQGTDFAILSKYEAQPIDVGTLESKPGGGDIAAWRLKVHGRTVNIFSVHLRSLFLTDDDRNTYSEIVGLENESGSRLRSAKNNIIPKIKIAAAARADQAKALSLMLDKYGGENTIVCGDFNDPVGCYSLDLLSDLNSMKQAYAEAGFGPGFTYYVNDLYFRIDHILYRGKMRPFRVERQKIKASDHYPLCATFVFDKPKN